MGKLRYLRNVVTLELDTEKCIGCWRCTEVCPHGVFAVEGSKAKIIDQDACMECGACSQNCPVAAIEVKSGVGCAVAVFKGMFSRGESECDCAEKSSQ